MSIFNNRILPLVVAALLFAGCQTGSAPLPDPLPEAESATELPAAADAATTAVEEAASQPQPEPIPVDLDQQAYAEAVESLKLGNTEQATELLVQVSNNAPDKAHVFTNLGLAYFRLKEYELAEQAFKQAIARDSSDAVAHNHIGILQRQSGQFDKALDHYQRAIEINPDYAAAQLNLGILYDIYFQDLPKALLQYQNYLSLTDGDNPQVSGWVVDIERRLKTEKSTAQG